MGAEQLLLAGSGLFSYFCRKLQSMEYDLIVIGGGAAGLMAAGTAAENGRKVLLLEKMEKPGRKVRITGKGRCNLTNTRGKEEFLAAIPQGGDFFAPAFDAFDNRATMRFFERHGLKLSVEQGDRVFPRSGKAWDVAETLSAWCRESGVEIACDTKVTEVIAIGGKIYGAVYRTERGYIRRATAPGIIIATGGASYPSTGSTGDGYTFAHRLGHTIEPIRPALVALESTYEEIPYLKGLLLKNVKTRLLTDEETAAEEFGEVAFMGRGLEGAAILRLSRRAVDALIAGQNVEVSLDLKPALDRDTILARIAREKEALPADARASDLMRKLLPKPLVVPFCKLTGVRAMDGFKSVTEEKAEILAAALKDFRMPVSDYRPFEEAVVTAGGVSLAEVNPLTMESKIVSGLYFAGEVLDIDGNTGGYNLQIAFSTGRLAGKLLGSNEKE